jgi:murein DD-endopeptidase MepM/ murein hydrolase activator NlpD
VYSLLKIQEGIAEVIKDLEKIKSGLETNKKETEDKKKQLLTLRAELRDQVRVLEESKKEKNKLLAETKNQESAYKNLLAEKKAKHDQFERELFQYESELRIAIDLNDIPSIGSKVLSWPLDKVFVTQYYGETPFSKTYNAYNGKGHNGLDLRASVGTKVKSALGGVVKGTGNTDVAKGCYSYGKWVLIEHANGLSSVYGHLSYASVKAGDVVATGDTIGYSGNTGYSFGPHLHFGVVATEGVRITRNLKSKYCSTVDMPSVSINAYLNPLSYL